MAEVMKFEDFKNEGTEAACKVKKHLYDLKVHNTLMYLVYLIII